MHFFWDVHCIWKSSEFNNGRPLASFARILSLGIGDIMESMVGHEYGVLRWSKAGSKTTRITFFQPA
ncbi:hypothetical protein HanXRQr2_Chr04g0174871 [Helianthus annuus]|uniref:Uncharacterized protein n=1 Tax=Helianthus annuus TaxID=4232 RepID=A0A9K3J8R4_HELAN|nr:hypothetical protein HanXRQr2_Chr04g0174871 [Helianthus annuus]KAJ0931997.1 hypothetical protein HanPSC8_Chr04g0168491 [Helianthus annuus]